MREVCSPLHFWKTNIWLPLCVILMWNEICCILMLSLMNKNSNCKGNTFRKYIQKLTPGWLQIEQSFLHVWDKQWNTVGYNYLHRLQHSRNILLAKPQASRKKLIQISAASISWYEKLQVNYFVLPWKVLPGKHCISWNTQNRSWPFKTIYHLHLL